MLREFMSFFRTLGFTCWNFATVSFFAVKITHRFTRWRSSSSSIDNLNRVCDFRSSFNFLWGILFYCWVIWWQRRKREWKQRWWKQSLCCQRTWVSREYKCMKSTPKANQGAGIGNISSKFFKLRIIRITLLMNPIVSWCKFFKQYGKHKINPLMLLNCL